MDVPVIGMLKEQYECPHFRILVIGRANAGKTTILEKICGVARGTKPIIYDENGVEVGPNIGPTSKPKVKSSLKFKLLAPIKQVFHRDKGPPPTHLTPSIEVSCMHMDFHPLINNSMSEGHTQY